MPGAPSSFLFLVVRPGAPSSVLAPNSDGLQPKPKPLLHFGTFLCYESRLFLDDDCAEEQEQYPRSPHGQERRGKERTIKENVSVLFVLQVVWATTEKRYGCFPRILLLLFRFFCL